MISFFSLFNSLQSVGLWLILLLLLVGCTPSTVVKYDPQDFINPNRVVTKKVAVHVPTPKVSATFGIGNDPNVVKAYKEFTQHGVAHTIRTKGFETFAYDPYAHPIVTCAPLHLCVIQLERHETINNIELGDSAHWLVGTSLIGSSRDGSYQVAVKPKLYRIATDLVITTNKRTYNIGLVSQQGASTHVVNFYYPQETLHQAIQTLHQRETSPLQQRTITTATRIDVDHINFNYTLHGDRPAWRPTRVFDDGSKTFIQMPPISERMDLPVLYIVRHNAMTMVNYRYRRPYYIIDGLFQRAYLVSGKGIHQVRVGIDNRNFS